MSLEHSSYLPTQAFMDEMTRQGQSLGFENIIVASGMSDVARELVESGNFDMSDDELRARIEPDLTSQLTRELTIKLPLLSAAMDTVTEHETAIVMAKHGGIGVLHYGLSPEDQFKELETVRKRLNGFIEKPKTLTEMTTFEEAFGIRAKHNFDTFPVTDNEGRLVGMVTKHELERSQPSDLVGDKMRPYEALTVAESMIDIEEAYRIMSEGEINTLPVVDNGSRELKGLYVFSDAKRVVVEKSGARNVDANGRYRCGIAVPTSQEGLERIKLCYDFLKDGGGFVAFDSANGDSPFALKYTRLAKEMFPDIQIMTGNVTNPDSAVALAQVGADAIKVGQASGGVCITYDETAIGRGQVTANWACSQALKQAGFGDVPVCSDGGIKRNGDLLRALAFGPRTIMVGSRFGATTEAAGERKKVGDTLVKTVRGMGSAAAFLAGGDRRFRYGNGEMPLAEGREEEVIVSGSLAPILEEMRKAIRKGLIYAGATDIESFQHNVRVEFDARRR